MIKFNLNNTRMWKYKLNMQAFNLFRKSMPMFILEMYWQSHLRTKWQTQCIVRFHWRNRKYVLNQNI